MSQDVIDLLQHHTTSIRILRENNDKLKETVTTLQEQNKKFEVRIKTLEDSKQSVQAAPGKSSKELEELDKRVKILEDKVDKLELARKSVNGKTITIKYVDINVNFNNIFSAYEKMLKTKGNINTNTRTDQEYDCLVVITYAPESKLNNENKLREAIRNERKKTLLIVLGVDDSMSLGSYGYDKVVYLQFNEVNMNFKDTRQNEEKGYEIIDFINN